jgi:hypothetical protein
VTGIGHHTEIDGLEESAMVIYRPLYISPVYTRGKHSDLRPVKMFMECVEKDGLTMKRFTKIEDPETLAKLSRIRDTMYT